MLTKVLNMPHNSIQTSWNAVIQKLALCFIQKFMLFRFKYFTHGDWLSNFWAMMMIMIAYSVIYQLTQSPIVGDMKFCQHNNPFKPSFSLGGGQSAKVTNAYSKNYRNWACLEHKVIQSIILNTYWKSVPQIKYNKLGNVCIA